MLSITYKKSRSWLKAAIIASSISLLAILAKILISVGKYEYDFIGQDYPMNLPQNLRTIDMHFHDHVRYPFSINVSYGMWIVDPPEGAGYIHLGTDRRAFFQAMWHELHCLQVIHIFFEDHDSVILGGESHFHHCLNYLRQYILCNADDTLEPGDYHEGDFGYYRQCFDWNALFDLSRESYRNFGGTDD